jgi:hypothetical protein
MVKINFPKLESFFSQNDISYSEFEILLNQNYNIWKTSATNGIENNLLERISVWLKVNPRTLVENTFGNVLELLLSKRWTKFHEYQIESIPKNLANLHLSHAEAMLIYEGTQTGIANCELQIQDIHEYSSGYSGSSPLEIRSEILEWLLNYVDVQEDLFQTGSLRLIGAHISAPKESVVKALRNLNGRDENDTALELLDSTLKIDLFFEKCSFNAGINISNCILQSLEFHNCRIEGDFIADNLISQGDVRFTGWDSGSEVFQTAITQVSKKIDIAGSVSVDYSSIQGHFMFLNMEIGGYLSLRYLDCKQLFSGGSVFKGRHPEGGPSVRLEGMRLSDIADFNNTNIEGDFIAPSISAHQLLVDGMILKGKLDISKSDLTIFKAAYADIRSQVTMNYSSIRHIQVDKCIFRGNIFANYSKSDNFYMMGSIFEKPISISYSETGFLDFSDSMFLGEGYSIDARAIKANAVFLTNLFAKHGMRFHKSSVNLDFQCSNSFLGPNNDAYCLTFSGSKAANFYFRDVLAVGTLVLDGTRLESLLKYERSVLIRSDDDMPAFDSRNVFVGKMVNSRSDKVDKINAYSAALKRKSEGSQIGIAMDVIANSEQAVEETILAGSEVILNYEFERNRIKPFEILMSENKEAFKKLTSLKNEKYNERYTIVIGETSFENAEICGRMDCAGTMYVLPEFLGLKEQKLRYRFLQFFPLYQIQSLIKLFFHLVYDVFRIIRRSHYRNFKPSSRSVPRASGKIARWTENYFFKKPIRWGNALTLSHIRISGDLFINKGPDFGSYKDFELPAAVFGQLDLHSGKVDNFFLTPDIGAESHTRISVNGFKYDFVYATDSASSLNECHWFFTDITESSFRQPFEQLATVNLRMGNDSAARKVLVRTPGKNSGEKVIMFVIAMMAKVALPAYRALIALILLWLVGCWVFNGSVDRKELIKSDSLPIKYSSGIYSMQLLVPLLPNTLKDVYKPTYKEWSEREVYIPLRPKWLSSGIPQKITISIPFSIYYILHGFFGTVLISFFLIGIARIIRNG